MARTKKQKPHDPAEAMRRKEEIASRRAERREWESRGATVNVDPRTHSITAIWRKNCFMVLLRGKQAELDAVDWLEVLIRTANGENGGERRPDFIRASVEGAPGQTVSQIMVDASRTLKAVEAGLRPWEWRMLSELLRPDAAILTRWRKTVEAITREVNPQAQGARVRAACEALAWVRQEIEKQPRMAA